MQYISEGVNQPKHARRVLIPAEGRAQGGTPSQAPYPVQQSDDTVPAESWRVCVRLDGVLARWLRARGEETGSTPSEVLRTGIRLLMAQNTRLKAILTQMRATERATQPSAQCAPIDGIAPQTAAGVPNSAEVPRFPAALGGVVKQMQGFGATSWTERRRRFIQAVALAQVCVEVGRDVRDGELLADLLRLGTKYNLFTV